MTTAMNQEEMQAAVAGIRALNKGTNKPYKPLTSKVEEYKDRAELEALERGEDIETASAYLLEAPQRPITEGQKKHLSGASTRLGQLWIRNK